MTTPPERVRRVRRRKSALGQAEDYALRGQGARDMGPGGPTGWTARFHGRCERPLVMRQQDMDEGLVAFTTDTWVRCRRCSACLRYRRAQWAGRIIAENVQASRSWFVTLTYKPGVMEHFDMIAAAKYRQAEGKPWREAALNIRATWFMRELATPVQLWLKRVRKRATARAKMNGEVTPRLRYVLIFEYGAENGRPHAHLVVHEAQGRVLEEELREEWSVNGFAQAKLLKHADRGAWYAAKYLAKALEVRVRASLRYGAWRTARPTTSVPASGPPGPCVRRNDPLPASPFSGRGGPQAAPQAPPWGNPALAGSRSQAGMTGLGERFTSYAYTSVSASGGSLGASSPAVGPHTGLLPRDHRGQHRGRPRPYCEGAGVGEPLERGAKACTCLTGDCGRSQGGAEGESPPALQPCWPRLE